MQILTRSTIMADYSFPPTQESVEAAKRDLIAFRLAHHMNPDPDAPAILVPFPVVLLMAEEVQRASRES